MRQEKQIVILDVTSIRHVINGFFFLPFLFSRLSLPGSRASRLMKFRSRFGGKYKNYLLCHIVIDYLVKLSGGKMFVDG